MSKIQEIIEHYEWLCDKGHPADETGRHIALLQALDVLADELARIGDIMEAEVSGRLKQPQWKA